MLIFLILCHNLSIAFNLDVSRENYLLRGIYFLL